VAVWYSNDSLGGTIGTDEDILVSRSTNNGASWTAPAALNSNAASDSGQDFYPQVTTDGAGNWVAAWMSTDSLGDTIGADWDILVSRSTNNGASWTAPAALNTNAASDSGSDGAPQVTTDGAGNWVAVWTSNDSLGGTIGTDADILVSRSTDNGDSWTAPAALNTNAATDSRDDYWPQVTTDGAGSWVTVWGSNDSLGGTIGTDYDILVSRSTNNGASWTAPAALNTNAASDAGDEYEPQVTSDGGGNWVAVWSSNDGLGGTIGIDNDILVSRSIDNGAAWTAPASLNTNSASDSGYDRNPQATTDGGGNWVAVWYSNDSLGGTIGTDHDILYTNCSPLDADCDGVPDVSDNCPDVVNPGQENFDGDSLGDVCDPDDDNDTAADGSDNCQFTANMGQENFDGDALGDACDSDDDNDSLPDGTDPCPLDRDCDNDGYWDADETTKGSVVLNAASTPEHCEGVDNDGDTTVDEEPAGGNWDTDGDTVKDCLDASVDTDGDTTVNTSDTDDDDDGSTDAREQYMSTDELAGCPTRTGTGR
jgi:hypothetical protein